jgi:hypothetical protein
MRRSMSNLLVRASGLIVVIAAVLLSWVPVFGQKVSLTPPRKRPLAVQLTLDQTSKECGALRR